MEKVVDIDLKDKVEITSQDIAVYLEKDRKNDKLQNDLKNKSSDKNSKIINCLRRKKAEEAYPAWIDRLKQKYAVEINKACLKNKNF